MKCRSGPPLACRRFRVHSQSPLRAGAPSPPSRCSFRPSFIVDDDRLQVVMPPLQIIQPEAVYGSMVGGTDVEHHEAVEIIEPACRDQDRPPAGQRGVVSSRRYRRRTGSSLRWRSPRLSPALGTLRVQPETPNFIFVRGTNAFVAVFQLDAEAHAVAHAVAGTVHCPQVFAMRSALAYA